MNKLVEKTAFKNRTAWNHLQTVRRAVETVSSWPEWKRGTVLFRDKSTAGLISEVTASVEVVALRKRSA